MLAGLRVTESQVALAYFGSRQPSVWQITCSYSTALVPIAWDKVFEIIDENGRRAPGSWRLSETASAPVKGGGKKRNTSSNVRADLGLSCCMREKKTPSEKRFPGEKNSRCDQQMRLRQARRSAEALTLCLTLILHAKPHKGTSNTTIAS